MTRRRLTGFTRTGGRGSRGRVVPPLPGGGIDWSRPRCEPDNSPRAVAGRLAAILVPLTVGLPIALGGLALSGSGSKRLGAWLAENHPASDLAIRLQSAIVIVVFVASVLLLAAWRLGFIASIRQYRRERRYPSVPLYGQPLLRTQTFAVRRRMQDVVKPPVEHHVQDVPAGQLVYRKFDSPVLTPEEVA